MKTTLTLFLLLCISTAGFACTNLLITRKASADNSNIVTYAADSHTRYGTLVHYPAARYKAGAMVAIYEWGKERYLGEIPQVSETYNVIGNMNEHQLVIGESTWGGLEQLYDSTAILDYGSLIYLALQRAKTAREAIGVITSLADRYGYASSGESLSIADTEEVWFMEIIGRAPRYVNGENTRKGAVWVAMRIPDGMISAHANAARITQFPLNDPENCLYAPDVISHARELGLFDGADHEFSFADTYGPLDFGGMRGCEARVWSFFHKYGDLDMNAYLDLAEGKNPKNRMPLYVKPKRPLALKEVMDMMRDRYEGTPFDMTQDIGAGGNELPYRWRPMYFKVDGVEYLNERAIATQQTGFWFVGQARADYPAPVGGLFWFGVDDAGTSPLTPVYTASTAVSHHYALGNGSMIDYSPTSMFWLTNRLAQFAYLRYNHIGAEIREVVDQHERERIAEIREIDRQAMALYLKSPKKARKYLTDYSVKTADALFARWEELDKYLLVKYIDGNTKKQDAQGNFITNGHSKTIPPSPLFPGYSEPWKRAVKEDAGERLKVSTPEKE